MIYDKIDNLASYTNISADIQLGLEWLQNVWPSIAIGEYELSTRVKAIVSEYVTKEENENGYEAHRQYIDIQYLASGKERICYIPLGYLREIKAYIGETDIAFYEALERKPLELELGNNFFAIFFPQDGHLPQLCANQCESVKKIVIKVKI